MKKILIVALSFIMLLLCIVPVGAEELPNEYYAKVVFKEGQPDLGDLSLLDSAVFIDDKYYTDLVFIAASEYFNSYGYVRFDRIGAWKGSGIFDGKEKLLYGNSTLSVGDLNYSCGAWSLTDGGWKSDNHRVIYILEEPSPDVMQWLQDNAESIVYGDWVGDDHEPSIPTCDGSECSVADFDVDGVCDTCGNMLAFSVQRTYTPNNWSSDLPAPPLGHDDNYHYVIMYINGYDVEDERGIYLHTFTPRQEYPTLSWDNRANGDFLTVTALIDDGLNVAYMNYHKYLLVNGEWVQKETSQSKYTARLGYKDVDDVVYSTLNLYTEEGMLFFPLPLWHQVESVVRGEMVEFNPMMGRTMMILTVSGIGLLALLILLRIFLRLFKNIEN